MSKILPIIDQLKELTLMEAADLVKAIEETFGVSAAAPVVITADPVAVVVEEKTEFNVKVTEVPADKKISVIKAVKTILNIGLADAKTKVESAPFMLSEGLKKEDAEKQKEDLIAAGAVCILE